jgi:death-on-curing protein
MTPQFLTVDDVVAGQIQQLVIYGGGEPGILNADRLDSAVHQPQGGFGDHYFHEDIFAMGGAYLKYLVLGHCFGNGNKRVALASALEFLYLNGVRVTTGSETAVQLVLDTIAHKLDTEQLAKFFRENHEPMDAAVPQNEGERQARLDEARVWMHDNYAAAFQVLAQ